MEPLGRARPRTSGPGRELFIARLGWVHMVVLMA